jgi:hypothetical protein
MPDWPELCYLPLSAAYAIVALEHPGAPATDGGEVNVVATLAAWRMTKGIYRIDPTLLEALLTTPVTNDIPVDVLYRLPEWCVYLDTPGATWKGDPLPGFWARLEAHEHGTPPELRLLLDAAPQPGLLAGLDAIPLILGSGGVADALNRVMARWSQPAGVDGQAAATMPDADLLATEIAPLVSCLLYVCSQAGEITGRHGRPANPVPVRTRRHGLRLFAAEGLRVWDVGVRIGAALRRAYQADQLGAAGDRAGPRPHVRRAHWHTILSGPRKRDDGSEIPRDQRQRDLRWMPPVPVNLDTVEQLPATIRRVE